MRSSTVLVILIASHILIVGTGRSEGRNTKQVVKPSTSVIYYNSQLSKNGSIKSPEYPYWSALEPYRKYVFQGEENELVQIIFENFNLFKKDSNVECSIEDSRLTYSRQDLPEVVLCGHDLPLPILADNYYFSMEFWHAAKSIYIGDGQEGFNATYKFVTNFGIESGDQKTGRPCEFDYDSSVSKNGSIYSPNFPGPYLWSMECIYYFNGIEPYIRLEFSNFSLFGSDECSRDDYVEIKVAADGNNNFFYKKLCGTREEPFMIQVNSSSLFVIFHSSDQYFGHDSGEGQQMRRSFVGFNASYFFTNDTINLASVPKSDAALLLTFFFIWSWMVF